MQGVFQIKLFISAVVPILLHAAIANAQVRIPADGRDVDLKLVTCLEQCRVRYPVIVYSNNIVDDEWVPGDGILIDPWDSRFPFDHHKDARRYCYANCYKESYKPKPGVITPDMLPFIDPNTLATGAQDKLDLK